eukprot:991457_1
MATWFRMGTLPLASRPMENISGRPRLRYANVHAPLLISLFKMKLASDPKCAVVNGTFSGGVSPTKCKVECIGRTKFLTGDDHGIVCESGGVWARGGTACVKPPKACHLDTAFHFAKAKGLDKWRESLKSVLFDDKDYYHGTIGTGH